jgi:hypothetical protein
VIERNTTSEPTDISLFIFQISQDLLAYLINFELTINLTKIKVIKKDSDDITGSEVRNLGQY